MGDFAKDYALRVDVTPTPNFDLPATFDWHPQRPDGRVADPPTTSASYLR